MNCVAKKIVRLLMTTFIMNYGLINPTYGDENENTLEVNRINKKKNKTAIEVSVGSFHPGPYAPYQINKKKWNNCNTLNFCDLNNLFGKNVGVTYIKRFYEKNNHKVDIDSSITFSSQKYGSNDKSFLMFSVIPTPSFAAFSPFTTTKLIFFDFIILGKYFFTDIHPLFPTISPKNKIFILWFPFQLL